MSRLIANKSTALDRWLTGRLSSAIGDAPVRLALWDGFEYCPAGTVPAGTVIIRKRSALLKLLLEPELYFGDGYSAGDIEVEGDLVGMLDTVYRAVSRRPTCRWFPALLARWSSWAQANSLRGSRRNIHHHYDLGTNFYQLWLDPQLLYTCAYFRNPCDTLEQAQIAKMDHVCRKLQLQPGATVVEAGCGWGALALHMARDYGAIVKAFNISRDQINYARWRAKQEGLSSRVEFIEDDYRNIGGRHEAFVSVGMLEHVGRENYRELGSVIHGCLADKGRGFVHFIGRNRPTAMSSWTTSRIFPGAFAPALREALEVFEGWDFSVLDVENLRLHYARTLELWLERYERSREKVAGMFNPDFVRMWRLYLTASIASFRSGSMQLFQVTFARGQDNTVPWTREHIYRWQDDSEQEGRWIRAMS